MSGHEELLGDEPVPAAVRPRDDASRNYIHIVDADEHHHELNPELLEACSKNFSMPVLFRKMVPLDDRVATRNFLEVNVDEKLVWRERTGDAAVAFRNEKGKTDYNYVSGREGTAREYLEQIFEQRKDVYAHL